MSSYAHWWGTLVTVAPKGSILIPSVGPDAGKLQDQADFLRDRDVTAAMLLPIVAPFDPVGLTDAMRAFYRVSGVPLIVYIKTRDYLEAGLLGTLKADGVVAGVKYAVPCADGAPDAYLDSLIAALRADHTLSGFGEPPAMAHLSEQNLQSFTSGCCCIAPALSMGLRKALKAGDSAKAQAILTRFEPLEALRNDVGEIRVLHEALAGAGIAETGPILKPCDPVPEARRTDIHKAAQELLAAEQAFRAGDILE